jgi:hypothetical protein
MSRPIISSGRQRKHTTAAAASREQEQENTHQQIPTPHGARVHSDSYMSCPRLWRAQETCSLNPSQPHGLQGCASVAKPAHPGRFQLRFAN